MELAEANVKYLLSNRTLSKSKSKGLYSIWAITLMNVKNSTSKKLNEIILE